MNIMDKPQGLCRNCNARPATLWWTAEGGVMAAIHGVISPWCERCCVAAQLEHAEKAAARVTELRARLVEIDSNA